MNHPTEPEAPHQTLDAVIDEAFDAARILPPHERCAGLNRQLRAAIGDLYLAVKEAQDSTAERSRDWYRLDNALIDTDAVLAKDLGSGLKSAAIQVAALAQQAQALRSALEGPR